MNTICRRVLLLALLAAPVCPVHADGRLAEFSGYQWEFRRTEAPQGPGPNVFLDNPRTIWVDDSGALHLRIWSRNRRWYCAEARLTESFGYGTYLFELDSTTRFDSPSVILGLFTYDHDAPDQEYREIDIEFGRFGDPKTLGGQFALQPFADPGNHYRFIPPDGDEPTVHGFRWEPGRIEFRSGTCAADLLFGLEPGDRRLLRHFVVEGDAVFEPGNETVHINLWLYRGEPPDAETEAVVRRFSFSPLE